MAKRFLKHSRGHVLATKNKYPLKLAYYEEFSSRSEAFKREMQFKNGRTRKKTIEKMIHSFPKAKCQGFNSTLQRRITKEMDLRKSVTFRKSRSH